MSFNIGKYNRYVTFETPTDSVSTSGSKGSRTWTQTFSSYAMKEDLAGDSKDESGRRITESNSCWYFPYNSAIVKDGRFYEGNATSTYYYVVDVQEIDYQREMKVEVRLIA
jgi:head-tail adaptor